MTEASVRAFLLGMLAAWALSVAWRRVRWWIADQALKKFLEKPDSGSLRDVQYPAAKPQGPAVVAVEETDPWPETPSRSPAEP